MKCSGIWEKWKKIHVKVTDTLSEKESIECWLRAMGKQIDRQTNDRCHSGQPRTLNFLPMLAFWNSGWNRGADTFWSGRRRSVVKEEKNRGIYVVHLGHSEAKCPTSTQETINEPLLSRNTRHRWFSGLDQIESTIKLTRRVMDFVKKNIAAIKTVCIQITVTN